MDRTHELVSALKKLHKELGRVPFRYELSALPGVSDWAVKKIGWNKLLALADLQSVSFEREGGKLTNAIFERNIAEVLDEHEPPPFIPQPSYLKVLCLGDTHFPFHSKRSLEAVYEFARDNQPDVIIQLGDLYDLYAHSKFPRSQNLYSPREEEALGREEAEKMWATFRLICPSARKIQIKGNHDIRPVRRTLEVQPTVEHIVSKYLDELMTFKGVELISDYREEFDYEGILFHHGYRNKLGDHRDYTLKNMVVGHTHKGGVVFRRLRGQTLWELNAGFLGDPDAKVFGYMAQKTCDYTLGFGWIDQHGPRFIPL